MSRSLSALESKLILCLEQEKQLVATIEETMHILDCSYDHARQVLHRLARRRWLALITPGTYELIPAERGEHAFSDANPLFIGSTLVAPITLALPLLLSRSLHPGLGHRLHRYHRAQETASAHLARQSIPPGCPAREQVFQGS